MTHRSREPSANRALREQQRHQRIRETARILKEELEREGFYVPEEGFNEVNLALGDSYKDGRDTPRTTNDIILDTENGPYAADRAAGRRSSVMVPNEMMSKFSRLALLILHYRSVFSPTSLHSLPPRSLFCCASELRRHVRYNNYRPFVGRTLALQSSFSFDTYFISPFSA